MKSLLPSSATCLLLSACCLFAASAAIVSERNDLFTYGPKYARFAGSPSEPGISSSYIPYGTYTAGEGSTEYLRVTSNLVGVVVSAFDGCFEREYVPEPDFSMTNDTYFGRKIVLLPVDRNHDFSFSDRGEFLDGATNSSLRLLARIGWDSFISCSTNDSGVYTYYGPAVIDPLEPALAHESVQSGGYSFHDGVAAMYGGRILDALAGAYTEPPIGRSWSGALPFVAAQSNEWRNVWPIYSAVTNDAHFFPALAPIRRYYRWNLASELAPSTFPGFFTPPTIAGLWGSDVFGELGDGAGADLELALCHMPLDVCMEDVLSADTGLAYNPPPSTNANDYAHWTNGTTRLDWKRLGIICQLERQMEHTYRMRDDEDELPLVSELGVDAYLWDWHLTNINIEIPPYAWLEHSFTVTTSLGHVAGPYYPTTHLHSVATNQLGLSYPLFRITPADTSATVGGGYGQSDPVWVKASDFRDNADLLLRTFVADHGYTSGSARLEIHGQLSADSISALTWSQSGVALGFKPNGEDEYSWVDFLPGGAWDFSVLDQMASRTNLTFALSVDVRKQASVHRTSARNSYLDAFLAGLSPYPQTNVWEQNYVESQWRPTLCYMHAIKGPPDNEDVVEMVASSRALSWDTISQHLGEPDVYGWRAWLYRPTAALADINASGQERWYITSELQDAVDDWAQRYSGFIPATSAFEASRVSSSERDALEDFLRAAPFPITVTLSPYGRSTNYRPDELFDLTMFASASVNAQGSVSPLPIELYITSYLEGSYETLAAPYDPDADEYRLGMYWYSPGSVSTNYLSSTAFGVDAHQGQMIKTLWRFKNLRDPEL